MQTRRRGLIMFASSAALLWGGIAMAATPPLPETSLNTCQNKVRTEGRKLVQNTVNAIGTCLQKVATEVIKKNADVAGAAQTCVAQFRKINDTRAAPNDKSLEQKFRDNVDTKCLPGISPDVTHSLADILGSGAGVAEQINAGELDTWCRHFGGDGSIDSLTEWEDCIVASYQCEATAAIAAQYPRAPEWLTEVRTEMLAVPPPASDPSRVTDAVAGLDAIDAAIDSDGDEEPDITCGGVTQCTTSCCYVENLAAPPDTECFEYTGTAAQSVTFKTNCDGGLPGAPGSLPFASMVNSGLGGPCAAGPSFGTLCVLGPPGAGNLHVIPKDSRCP